MEIDISAKIENFKELAKILEQYGLKIFELGICNEDQRSNKVIVGAYLIKTPMEPVKVVYGRLVVTAPNTVVFNYFLRTTVLEPVEIKFVAPAVAQLVTMMVNIVRDFKPLKQFPNGEKWHLIFRLDNLQIDYIEQYKLIVQKRETSSLTHYYYNEVIEFNKSINDKIDLFMLTNEAVKRTRFLPRPFVATRLKRR